MSDQRSFMHGTTVGGQIAGLLLDHLNRGSVHDGWGSIGHRVDGGSRISIGGRYVGRTLVTGHDVLRCDVLLDDRGLRDRVGQRNGVRADGTSFGGNGQRDHDCSND
uniref:Uncharacterized protein n=1 Tax=Anopheles albimanus TaxID=7167 RepID=A0A182FWK9_ANOAL